MPSRICDKTPCHYLAQTLQVLAVPSVDTQLDIIVESSNPEELKRKVTLWYCPFCGSRIEQNWLKLVRKRGYG